jgi:predicted XRE-type DNA-binding protein
MNPNEYGGTNQRSIKFFRDLQVLHPPLDAPRKHVLQCHGDLSRAMRWSMKASSWKQEALAEYLGIKQPYLSKLVNLKHNETGELPEWFVLAFCCATGSRLLEQVIELSHEEAEQECERALARRMASQLPVRNVLQAAA